MRFISSKNWTQVESLEAKHSDLSQETYLLIVSAIASLSGAVHGYLIIQSEFLLMDSKFIQTLEGRADYFTDRFSTLFYFGEMVGAALSFVLSDTLGRKYCLVYATIFCIIMLLWSCLKISEANLLTSRFCVGWALGVMMATAPVYTTEVRECRN